MALANPSNVSLLAVFCSCCIQANVKIISQIAVFAVTAGCITCMS